MNINYTKYSDYYLPELKLTEKENKNINKYGLLKLEYLKNNDKALYQSLLMNEQLNDYLFSVSIEIESKVNTLTNKLIENDKTITENLKSSNQMIWVQKMNQCKITAEEIIINECIYGDKL